MFVPIPLPTVADYFCNFGVPQIVDLVFYPDLPVLGSADTAWWGCAVENCIGYAMECKPRLKEAEPPAAKAELFRKDCWLVQISIFWQARRATLYCIFLPKCAQQKPKQTKKKERGRKRYLFFLF